MRVKTFSLFGVFFFYWSVLAIAQQTLVFRPLCGKAASNVCVTGSGWAEPAPPCHYRFYFDGTQATSDQPDGLFGPPAKSFTVPAGAANGDHKIKVDLRFDSNDQLVQPPRESGDGKAPKVPFFKVVDNSADPFKPSPFNTANRFDIAFDPTDVCEIGTCTEIGLIQVGQVIGTKADGTTQPLKMSDSDKLWPAAVAAEYDTNSVTVKDAMGNITGIFFLDRYGVRATPYFGGNGAGTGHWTKGSNDKTPIVVAKIDDTPSLPNGPKIPGFVKVMYNFETAVFCVSGDDKGRYYGIIKWKYESNIFTPGGTTNTSTLISATKGAQPSSNFIAALNAWLANPKHAAFKLPAKAFPLCP